MKEELLLKRMNSSLALIFGISFFFLNLGISVFYLLSFFLIFYHLLKKITFSDFLKKIILCFFLYGVVINFYVNYSNVNTDFIFKNLLYLKFYLLFLVLTIFFQDKNLIKKIFYVNFLVIIFLIFDIFFQRITSFDLFGIPIHPYNRATGPYGEELIPGALILYIGFHSFLYFLISLKFKNKINEFLYFIVLFNLYFFSIYLTGERMNFLVSLLVIALMILILFRHRLKLIISTFVFFFLILLTFTFNLEVSKKYESFTKLVKYTNKLNLNYLKNENLDIEQKEISKNLGNNILQKPLDNKQYDVLDAHLLHFSVAIEIWKDFKIFGSGIGSFRKICGDYDHIGSFVKEKSCSTHPHNFILELLSETGIFGTAFFIFILFYIIKTTRINLIETLKNPEKNIFLVSFFIMFLCMIWPFKTSGRVFSNFYGTMFWYNIFAFYIVAKYIKIEKIYD